MGLFRKRSPVVEDLADHLRTGSLSLIDLQRSGVCELGFEYLGSEFRITWYSGGIIDGSPRDVSLDGDRFFATSSDCRYLTSEAVKRASRLFYEKVNILEARRAASAKRTGA